MISRKLLYSYPPDDRGWRDDHMEELEQIDILDWNTKNFNFVNFQITASVRVCIHITEKVNYADFLFFVHILVMKSECFLSKKG